MNRVLFAEIQDGFLLRVALTLSCSFSVCQLIAETLFHLPVNMSVPSCCLQPFCSSPPIQLNTKAEAEFSHAAYVG